MKVDQFGHLTFKFTQCGKIQHKQKQKTNFKPRRVNSTTYDKGHFSIKMKEKKDVPYKSIRKMTNHTEKQSEHKHTINIYKKRNNKPINTRKTV